jgi:hypothetical protein
MLLCLDFDSVLRRTQAPLYCLEQTLLDRLVVSLREYPEVSVVITSSWTEAFSLEEIKRLFPADIALRILGQTPRVQTQSEPRRHLEVGAYLRCAGLAQEWVAVDDDPLNYPPHAPVVLVDPGTGLDAAAVAALERYFNEARGNTYFTNVQRNY